MKSRFFRLISMLVILSMVITPALTASAQTPAPQTPRFTPDRSGLEPVEYTPKTPETLFQAEPESAQFELSGRYVILFEGNSLLKSDLGKGNLNSPASKAYLADLRKAQDAQVSSIKAELGHELNVHFRYDVILNGISIDASPMEAAKIAALPGVRQVIPVTIEHPDTDAGPQWIGADTLWSGANTPDGIGTKGEGIIAGILDTGINFDHPSFADPGPVDGFNFPTPAKYLGVCDSANVAQYDAAYVCNDKLIGAYSFTTETLSPEDSDGHGSHTGSTVAGNVVTLDYLGVSTTISGMAPHAQIISYDVCDEDGCYGDGSAAAVQQAILDGVDVINYSISGGKAPYTDIVELAFLDAYDAGIFVAASAGNLREEPSTDGQVNHLSPWVMTVAASSHNRKFTNDIDVVSPANPLYTDMALISGSSPFAFPALDDVELKWAGTDTASSSPVDYLPAFADNRLGCSAFPVGFFTGKVALIRRGSCSFAIKVDNAAAAGAVGVLIYADNRPPISPGGMETTTIPAGFLFLSAPDALAFETWVAANAPVLIDMSASGRVLNAVWGDIKADFSFRGPGMGEFPVLKPEITAPGLEILAAYADGVIDADGDIDAAAIQGTSMSSPHTAGAGALVKALHPTWSAGMIKSAIMLTAKDYDLLKEDMVTEADLFDFGSGRVNLAAAGLTGLVLDETVANFEDADPSIGGDPKTLNLASLQDNTCVGSCSWERTFTSVSDAAATYTADAPAWVTVDPATFTIAAGGTQLVTFSVDASALTPAEWAFGTVYFDTDATFVSGDPVSDVHLPVAVLPSLSNLPASLKLDTFRDADGVTLNDLRAAEITDFAMYASGLVKGDIETIILDPDPTNGDALDDLSQVYVKTFNIPAYGAIRLVTEVTATTASDVDIFVFWDADGSGDLDPAEDYLVAQSATGASLEYVNLPWQWVFWGAPDTYFLVVQNWSGHAGDTITLSTAIVPYAWEANLFVEPSAYAIPGNTPFSMDIFWDEDTEEGDRLYGYLELYPDPSSYDMLGETYLDIRRGPDDVVKTVDVTEALPGDTVTYTITITNNNPEATTYTLEDVIPDGTTYVPGSVTGGAVYDPLTDSITWTGLIDPPTAPYYVVSDSITDPLCDTGFGGYVNLQAFGIAPSATRSGDGKAWGSSAGTIPFNFYNVEYSALYYTDDGIAIFDAVNTWVPAADLSPQQLPNTELPNALAAMLWQDMVVVADPANFKGVSAAVAGADTHVIEFDDVYLKSDPTKTYDYEIVYTHSVYDDPGWYEIVFAYNNINGPVNQSSIGVEDYNGKLGTQYAYNDASFTNGHMVCFDLLHPSSAVTFTYQVTVDADPTPKTITNVALHNTDRDYTLEEEAIAEFDSLGDTPGNDTPVAVNDVYAATEDTLLVVPALTGLMANDFDIDLDAMVISLLTDPAHGKVTVWSDGSFEYMPDENFNGTDSFTYRLITYPPVKGWTDDATVTINVAAVNDAPVASTIANVEWLARVAHTYGITPFTDVDGDTLTYSATADGAALPAWLTINPATGEFSGTPANENVGVYVIEVTASDGHGGTVSTTFTLTVTFNPFLFYLPIINN